MITVSINANPDIENKINNYVKENNINLNQVMLDLILEKIEDEEDYKLAVETYEEEKDNRENWISHEDLIKKNDFQICETELIKRAKKQLFEYFEGKRKNFDLPLLKEGTPFQISVWSALEKIPYGETRSYKDIAIAINNPKAVRSVGMANNRNKIAIFIPCHRVIGADGKLVGYGGGLHIKRFLLELEGIKIN